jgi:hypothetical protein
MRYEFLPFRRAVQAGLDRLPLDDSNIHSCTQNL